jgi:hypothetical protein
MREVARLMPSGLSTKYFYGTLLTTLFGVGIFGGFAAQIYSVNKPPKKSKKKQT